MKMIGQTLIHHSHAVIWSSSREAEKASKYLKSANIEICPWGIREPDTTNNSLWKEEIKKKLNIPSEKRIAYKMETEYPHYPEKCYTIYCFIKNKPIKQNIEWFLYSATELSKRNFSLILFG
jgi:hypothetical protein